MNLFAKICSLAFAGMFWLVSSAVTADVVESLATQQLISRNAEFEKDIIQVSESVYTAVGYAVSPVSMIVGPEGLVIVDTGVDAAIAKTIRADFRKISDKPVKAIIFTHGHGDHTHGAVAFLDSPDVQIWAREGFGHEQHTLEDAGVLIQKRRGAMQAGFALLPKQRINNGIAKAYWPKRKGGVFSADHKVAPTHFLKRQRRTLTVAGLELVLVAATGETHDHLYINFPAERVVFSGDNFYKSWPNLYALRGTPYRDIRAWAKAIDKILQERPSAVVGGHTRPIVGEKAVNETLTNFKSAIDFLFNKTVEGINKGMTPAQLVEYVVLPEKYQSLDYLRPYYGNPEWAIRAIFSGYLGWFDGNATNLFPLGDREEAERIGRISGGVAGLSRLAKDAIEAEDYQWAAQLCDYILALEPGNKPAHLYKAQALENLADNILTATARNYYLSSAMQLRKVAQDAGSEKTAKNPVEESRAEPAIKITFLGTGTPVPNKRQFGQGIVIESGDTKLLFDCGRACAHHLWNLGPAYLRETSHLFLTHMHSDHTVGVPDLYMNGWNLGRKDNLRVYGPAQAETFMRHLRLAFEEDVVFRADRQKYSADRESLNYIATEVMDNKPITIGKLTVTPFIVDHHVVAPAFGYRVDVGEYSVVVSGDTAYSENLIRHSAEADVVIHEVMSPALEHFVRSTFEPEVADDIVALHTLAPDVGRVFTKTKTRLGVLTHLDNEPKKLPQLNKEIRSTWAGDFVVAEDLMTIEVGESIRITRPDTIRMGVNIDE